MSDTFFIYLTLYQLPRLCNMKQRYPSFYNFFFDTMKLLISTYFSFNELHIHYNEQLMFVRLATFAFKVMGASILFKKFTLWNVHLCKLRDKCSLQVNSKLEMMLSWPVLGNYHGMFLEGLNKSTKSTRHKILKRSINHSTMTFRIAKVDLSIPYL